MLYTTKLIPLLFNSAKEVRSHFGDPEPKAPTDSHILRDVTAMLGGIIGQGKQATKSSAGTECKTQGLTFDSLPFDVKFSIFEMVGSLPSWVYFRYKKGKLVELWGGNREVYVNEEWHESRQLRRGLSTLNFLISKPAGADILAEGVLRLLSKDEPGVRNLQERHRGDPRFSVRNNDQVNPILTRREIDWFFFDNCVNMVPSGGNWSMPHYIHSIRICVFGLDTVFHKSWNPPPDFIWPRCSHVEELIILVGRFRKEVPPSRMKVIKAFQANLATFKDTLSEYDDEIFEHEDTRYEKYLLRSEKYMIGEISRRWCLAFLNKHHRRHKWLDDEDGLRWLAYPVHDDKNELSIWLATPEGHDWLGHDWHENSQPGFRFLASESGWWWLASDFGFPWLETEQGLGWLGTKKGQKFLKSRQALLWANTSTYNPSSLTPLGTQVRKAWFNTVAGIEWKFHNCPDGNPPAPPQPPQRDSNPPPNVEFPTHFKNPHFRGWRFVICPEEISERATSRRK
ncbi:uncharacterized protein F4817DRAFT_365973 [Daldinia loculata]|uniref:uncharacterized protein n=1 Tax=Daldinia loculata TaxID=103429 RepID=UPI0020C58294|nr:uncharacterized protein F4817DRAFT_365973 [Daldinia loculata]KAI1646547.1 hypothetical protein F4817DRAFT_365973 [Daldinia loculata]